MATPKPPSKPSASRPASSRSNSEPPVKPEGSKRWGQVIAQAWTDDKFKKRLIDNPSKVLKEQGVTVPAGVEFRVVENTKNVVYLTLPTKPADDVSELTDRELTGVTGGAIAISPLKAKLPQTREEDGWSVDCTW
jgi:hypothetical protein